MTAVKSPAEWDKEAFPLLTNITYMPPPPCVFVSKDKQWTDDYEGMAVHL